MRKRLIELLSGKSIDTYADVEYVADYLLANCVTEAKHGVWILHPDGSGTCKNCNTNQKSVWDMDNYQKYCGHCGAKMHLLEKVGAE